MPRAFAWGGTDVAVQDMRRRRRDGIDGAGDEGVPQIMAVRGTTSSTSGRAVELDSPVDRGPRTLARGGELNRAWEARQDCLMAEMQVVRKYGYIKVGYCVGMRRCYVVLMDELRKKMCQDGNSIVSQRTSRTSRPYTLSCVLLPTPDFRLERTDIGLAMLRVGGRWRRRLRRGEDHEVGGRKP